MKTDLIFTYLECDLEYGKHRFILLYCTVVYVGAWCQLPMCPHRKCMAAQLQGYSIFVLYCFAVEKFCIVYTLDKKKRNKYIRANFLLVMAQKYCDPEMLIRRNLDTNAN